MPRHDGAMNASQEPLAAGTAPAPAARPARNLALDGLKCLLALAVVAIHTSPLLFAWPQGNYFLVNGLCRVAVPTFFVIGGFYLAPALGDAAMFGRWWRRMLGLYLFWTLVYAPFFVAEHHGAPGAVLITVVFGYLQLWYIAALVVAGPLVWWAQRRLSAAQLMGVACALFAVGVVLQWAPVYGRFADHHSLYRNAVFLAFPFVAFGVLIRRGFIDELTPWQRRLGLLAGFAGLAVETALARAYGQPGVGVDIYVSLLLICPLLFDRFRQARFAGTTAALGTLSSVVYFSHALGIEVSRAVFHLAVGAQAFAVTLLCCGVLYFPLTWLSRRWRFVL